MAYLQTQSVILIGLGILGLYLVWGLMWQNGSLEILLKTALSGTYANGRNLKSVYSGIWLLDFLLCILVVFFDSLVSPVDPAPYLILLELVSTLLVVNVMTLVEGRRRGCSKWLSFPAFWQYAWNCGGVAVFLPIWILSYMNQIPTHAAPLPAIEAQALPVTAMWSLALTTPLMLPSLVGASSTQTQNGVILFFLTPPLYVAFQSFTSTTFYKREVWRKPVELSYTLVGAVSALIHVCDICYITFAPSSGLSLGRVYYPKFQLFQPQQDDVLTEGALLFIQYDYIMMSLTIFILGLYILCLEPISSVKSQTNGMGVAQLISTFAAISAVLGPGAGLAYVLRHKESYLPAVDDVAKRNLVRISDVRSLSPKFSG